MKHYVKVKLEVILEVNNDPMIIEKLAGTPLADSLIKGLRANGVAAKVSSNGYRVLRQVDQHGNALSR